MPVKNAATKPSTKKKTVSTKQKKMVSSNVGAVTKQIKKMSVWQLVFLVVSSAVVVLVVIVGFFTLLEAQKLKSVANIFHRNTYQQLSQLAKIQGIVNEFQKEQDMVNDQVFSANNQPSFDQIKRSFSDADSELAVVVDAAEEYQRIADVSLADFEQYRSGIFEGFGSGSDVNQFVESQVTVGQLIADSVESDRATLALQMAVFEVVKDDTLFVLFTTTTGGFNNEGAIQEAFPQLASLEKYTVEDFQFDQEDLIGKHYPTALGKMDKQVTFLKNIYEAIKDLVAGKYESAVYKFSRLGDDIAEIGSLDFEKMFEESKAAKVERNKKLVDEYLRIRQQITGLQEKGSLFGAPDWDTTGLACQTLLAKIEVYYHIKDEYPSSVASVDQLFDELNQVTPSIAVIEPELKNMITVGSDLDTFTVTCKTGSGDFVFPFFIPHDEE